MHNTFHATVIAMLRHIVIVDNDVAVGGDQLRANTLELPHMYRLAMVAGQLMSL